MARNITLTLGSSAGADLGPFNITVSTGTITPTTATRSEMLAGKSFSISSDSAVTVTTTSTGACTNNTTTSIAAAPTSNVTVNLQSDISSEGDIRVQYTNTSNLSRTLVLNDESGSDDVNLTDVINNVKPGTSITVSVNKYNSGTTTLESSPGPPPPSVQLIITKNGAEIKNQLVGTGLLTVNHTFSYNTDDVVIISGTISQD